MRVFMMGIREKISFHFNNKNINHNNNDTNDTVSTIIMRLTGTPFYYLLVFSWIHIPRHRHPPIPHAQIFLCKVVSSYDIYKENVVHLSGFLLVGI